jgi:hypothetical protein
VDDARVPARALLRRIRSERALRRAAPELSSQVARAVAVDLETTGLRPDRLEGLDDAQLHALAAIERARLRALAEDRDDATLEASARSLVRLWAALGTRRDYLEALARPVLGAAAAGAADLAARRGVELVAAALQVRLAGEGDLAPFLRALAEACDASSEPVGRLAQRARDAAIDAVLAPARARLDELATRRPTTDELVVGFAALAAAWRRCDRDQELEVLAVERLPDFAWDLYRERRLDELRRVLDTIVEPVVSLAARIERGEPALAWAAPCAQALVFRAELAPRFDEQLVLAERAHALCPTLRNARIVLADFLVTRAERALDRGLARSTAGTTPTDDVARAEAIFPELKRLPGVRERLGRRER